MFKKKFNQKDKKEKNIDLAFFFFFLSSLTGLTHSFFFLLTCSSIGNNQIILIKNFRFINIFCSVFSFLSLFVSCLFDYHKFTKKFSFFREIGLSTYIFSIIICFTIFIFNGFFIKILFQVKTKNDFMIAEETKYKNFFNFAITNFICVFFLYIMAIILQLKARKNIFCFDDSNDENQNEKSSPEKKEKSNFMSN